MQQQSLGVIEPVLHNKRRDGSESTREDGKSSSPCFLHNKRRDSNESAREDGKSSPASSTRGETAMTAPGRMGKSSSPCSCNQRMPEPCNEDPE